MRLKRLNIIELHNCFDYNIKFNKDVTFLYGSNGCGKTTILNITEIIITGSLYKLFGYEFKKIELEYEPIKSAGKTRSIEIDCVNNTLRVQFEDQKVTIERIEEFHSPKSKDEIERFYFKKYNILKRIKDSFNYVYLPLDRKTGYYNLNNPEYRIYRYRDMARHGVDYHNLPLAETEEHFNNGAIIDVQSLISNYYSKTNMEISRINNDFRNQIVKSSIDVLEKFNIKDFVEQISSNSDNEINKVKRLFITISKDLNLISEEEEPNYEKFFQDYLEQLHSINNNKKEIGIEIIAKYQEITRIKKIATMAEEAEKKKEQLYKPIETFINTINAFVRTSDDNKELKINEYGELFFETKYSTKHIDIQYLSSGEKQLVIFFANLIFRVQGSTSGIFVVDGPELSLHLSWQKIFVEKVFEINKNVQLVFATHSPEIIGPYRNKMYKLNKTYVG